MYALVDCNNFFVSCERVFSPAILRDPVVVLSNNDGCVIARSNEAKALGIKMGVPVFGVRELIREKHVRVFSANYSLYGDMSRRVMQTLDEFVSKVEVYSIDEAFLWLEELSDGDAFGRQVVRTVRKNTGIPVSIGIAPTKTLAKVASWFAKHYSKYEQVCLIDSEEKRVKALRLLDVGEVWGIGSQNAGKLARYGVDTAYDFVSCPEGWVRRLLSVNGVRTWKELQGTPCIGWGDGETGKHSICTSRSFGDMISDYDVLSEVVADFTASCAYRLRKKKRVAGMLMVSIETNRFREDLPQFVCNQVAKIPVPSNDTAELIHYARLALRRIYRKGYRYKKAGVLVADIVPESYVQGNLFDRIDRMKRRRFQSVVDSINRKYGIHTITCSIQGRSAGQQRHAYLSKNYTTDMKEIIRVNAEK